MQWQSGQSGNVAGIPQWLAKARYEVGKLACQSAPEMLQRLIDIARSGSKDALQAASLVLDRAMGKPNQAIDVTSNSQTIGFQFVFPMLQINQQVVDNTDSNVVEVKTIDKPNQVNRLELKQNSETVSISDSRRDSKSDDDHL